MSEDATQQLLMARVDRLISMVEPISRKLDNLESRFDKLENQQRALSTAREPFSGRPRYCPKRRVLCWNERIARRKSTLRNSGQ